jgi:hypothetical protein
MIKKYIFDEKQEKILLFYSKSRKFRPKMDHNIDFQEKRQIFFAENLLKPPKVVIRTLTPGSDFSVNFSFRVVFVCRVEVLKQQKKHLRTFSPARTWP